MVVQSKTSQAVQNNVAIDANSVETFLSDLRLPYWSYDRILGDLTDMGFCNRQLSATEELRRNSYASFQADNWWCQLPDRPRP
jgi:hypothetical protein